MQYYTIKSAKQLILAFSMLSNAAIYFQELVVMYLPGTIHIPAVYFQSHCSIALI